MAAGVPKMCINMLSIREAAKLLAQYANDPNVAPIKRTGPVWPIFAVRCTKKDE